MWKKYNIAEGTTYYWKSKYVEFWVKKINKEWLIATKSIENPENESVIAATTKETSELEWKSYIADKNNNLNIVPAFPDKAIIARPVSSFKLLPKMNVQLYVHVPVWIQLYNGTVKNENLICEFPARELSNTWFGEPDNGSLSYALPGSLSTQLEKNKLENYEIICPVRISNESATTLDFQRFSLQVEFLNVYQEDGILYSNEVKIKHKGENTVSDINYSRSAPSFIENSKHIASPRNTEKSSVITKSFHLIKSITNY